MGALLKMFVLLGIIFLGGFFLFESGLLPPSFYPAAYQVLDTLPTAGAASMPYLEKFEGHWSLTVAPQTTGSAYGDCPAFTSILASHDGVFAGHAAIASYLLAVEASTTVGGIVTGNFYSSNKYYSGTLSGTIGGASGSGSWTDSNNCAGTWTLVKDAPVNDPVQAQISSVTGRVKLQRGSLQQDVWPEEPLYVGDKIIVPAGGKATLIQGIGRQLVTMQPGTTYVVPDVGGMGAQ